MKIVLKYIQLTVISLLCLGSALGCSYIGYPNPPAAYIAAKTGTIFIGRVISTSSTIQTEDDFHYRLHKIKFKVEKALKGVDNEIQEITLYESITQRTSCSVDPPKFKKGEKWIIHKNFSQEEEVSINLFGSSFFQPNWKYVTDANQDYIEKLEKAIQNPVIAITGHVQLWSGAYLPGSVEVSVQGNGLELLTKTDKTGFYSFENIPAGKYKIQIRLSYEARDWFHDNRTVFDPQTNIHNLTYEVLIRNGDTNYHYSVVSKPPTI